MNSWWGNVYKAVKDAQPIRYTGAMRHVVLWTLTPFTPHVFQNPQFNPESKRVTVYCIHGTADRAGAFSIFAPRLFQDNQVTQDGGISLPDSIDAVRLVGFEDRGKGVQIDVFARQLKNQIESNGDENVVLIGHSRGGLVASHFAEYLAQESGIQVQGVITICTPFSGSDLARPPFTWMSDSISEMQPNSPYLTSLTSSISTSSVIYYNFSAENDEIVAPFRCAIPGRETQLVQLARHSHLSVLGSHKLVGHVRICIGEMVGNMLMKNHSVSVKSPV